jgi:hypothetical protein
MGRKFLNGEFGTLDGRDGSTPSRDAWDFFGVTGMKSTSLWSIRSVRGFACEYVDGFVGEGGVCGIVAKIRLWAGIKEDDSDVDIDNEEDDEREDPLEENENESSELDDELRLLCGKYLGFARASNGEADRDAGCGEIGSMVPIERSERGEVSSMR